VESKVEHLKQLLGELGEERERLNEIMYALENEPWLSIPLARIDRRIAMLQAEVEHKLEACEIKC